MNRRNAPHPVDGSRTAFQDGIRSHAAERKFVELFGVSRADLEKQGIDPNQYAIDNVREALKDRKKRALVLEPADRLKIDGKKWGLRTFYAVFVGYGFLMLSLVHPIHEVAFDLAVTCGVAGLGVWVLSSILLVKARRARKQQLSDG